MLVEHPLILITLLPHASYIAITLPFLGAMAVFALCALLLPWFSSTVHLYPSERLVSVIVGDFLALSDSRCPESLHVGKTIDLQRCWSVESFLSAENSLVVQGTYE